MTTTFDRLKSLNLPDDTMVSLEYSEGTDVFVHNETDVDTALEETDVVSSFSDLITTPGLLTTTTYGDVILDVIREEGHLDSYERDGTFSEFVTEVLTDNFYDLDLIEHSTEKYDYKRGFCTLTAGAKATLGDLMNARPYLLGWKVSVQTDQGTLTIG